MSDRCAASSRPETRWQILRGPYARILGRAAVPRRHSCGAGRRQRVWRHEAADRLFRRYDERPRSPLRAFQSYWRGPRGLSRNPKWRCDSKWIERREPGESSIVQATNSGRGPRGASQRGQLPAGRACSDGRLSVVQSTPLVSSSRSDQGYEAHQ